MKIRFMDINDGLYINNLWFIKYHLLRLIENFVQMWL